jgi:phage repressor protein C with HTH and peptisase S24 domain
MFRILRISGDSMLPEYQSGDFVLIRTRSFFSSRFRAGDVIVFHNQLYGMLIKHIEKITDAGIYVIGTGENSLDSRRLGPVNPVSVQGKVIWHICRN